MRAILLAALVALLVTLTGTPFAIRLFRSRGFGQLIREDIGHFHGEKRGTPTMGGLLILGGITAGYLVAHAVASFSATGTAGLLVLGAAVGLGLVGFTDDYIKIRHQRSLGLNKTAKVIGQLVVAVGFALGAQHLAGASTNLSFVRQTALSLGPLFVVWVFLIMAGTSNGVNLTDGLDGLAAGSSALVFAAYVVIAFWQFRHPCTPGGGPGCYSGVPDPLDLAILAAAALGACAGFLWWNAAPARIFMGDTGSLALGGALAALAVMTSTQLLLVILGGLFVIETTSVVVQVGAFHLFKRRVFKMAPMHHHFELGGWPEFTVIVRFWIIAGLAAALGLGLFYADFLARGGVT
ncbi:MAG: phospho-N-acetylmuramoyl-pentapeptide-transferase [Actinomycetota bacterium]